MRVPAASGRGLAASRGRSVIVRVRAANAPAVEARRTTPLPKHELVEYLAKGCRPRSNWR
jgi:hypothetical protein